MRRSALFVPAPERTVKVPRGRDANLRGRGCARHFTLSKAARNPIGAEGGEDFKNFPEVFTVAHTHTTQNHENNNNHDNITNIQHISTTENKNTQDKINSVEITQELETNDTKQILHVTTEKEKDKTHITQKEKEKEREEDEKHNTEKQNTHTTAPSPQQKATREIFGVHGDGNQNFSRQGGTKGQEGVQNFKGGGHRGP